MSHHTLCLVFDVNMGGSTMMRVEGVELKEKLNY
jgi:hypothetical protein